MSSYLALKIGYITKHIYNKGGWLTPPWVFDTLQYLETILPSVESLWSSLYKMRYILLVVALLEVCDVTKHGSHLGSHLGFYQKLNSGKNSKNKQFLLLSCKITKVITLHHFTHKLYFYSWKKLKKTYFLTQKRLDHLLLMTSYLVTIVTDHH